MATFLIALFSVVLVLVCLFVTLLVLMQKPSANSGMGAALGGGAAEQAFGGEATNVLTRGTIYSIIAFFVLSFGLYLGTLAANNKAGAPSEGASITRLTEGEAAEAAAAKTGEEIESTPAATDEDSTAAEAATEATTADQAAEVDPAAILEEVKGSAAEAIEENQGAAEKEEKAPIQLESLDTSSSNSGS